MIKLLLTILKWIFNIKEKSIPDIEEAIIEEAIKTPEVIDIKPPETIEELIKRIANEEKVEELLCLSVAKCESNFNSKVVNIKGNYPSTSKDRGLFQINSYWHKGVSDEMAFDPEYATKFFCKAVKDGKLSWWNSSKYCWSKLVNQNIIDKYL